MKIALVPFCSVDDNQPDTEGLNRLNGALKFLRAERVDRIMVSGGHRQEVDLSLIYYAYLREQGVREDQLIIEGQSSSTLTNLANSAKVLAEQETKSEKIEIVYIFSGSIHLTRIGYLIFYSRLKYKTWPWPVRYIVIKAVYNKKIGYTLVKEVLKILITILDPEHKSARIKAHHEQRSRTKY